MIMRILLAVLLILMASVVPTLADPPTAPGAQDRCAVCGMFVSPYPNWVSVIRFRDGQSAYFDGPRDMFSFFFNLETYRPGTTTADIAEIYVTEYYSTKLQRAESVYFVSGSEVMGPMGAELVPIGDREQAETFRRDHDGKKIMRFDGKDLVEVSAAP